MYHFRTFGQGYGQGDCHTRYAIKLVKVEKNQQGKLKATHFNRVTST